MQAGGKIKQSILKLLESHPEGLAIVELARLTNFHRQTVAKYLLFLEALGAVARRDLGAVSLHYHAKHSSNLKSQRRREDL